MLNITNIPAPRVPFIDERTGLMAREWYRFFLNLFVLTGSGNNPITLEELQLGPPNQPDLAELLIQINQNIAPQYEDQSGDFLATLDTAQLMSMMSQVANAEAAIQGAYLQPVVQTGTIANYNLDGSPTAGGIAYGTGPALAVSVAGTLGQVLTSGGAGAPTWATDGGGTVTSVSVVSANGLAGTVATATTTPAITLSTTVTGLLKGNGTAISAATSGTDYAPATSGTSILYGNGAGGFSNVTIGTGVAFSAGTLSATGSGGTVTNVAALTLGTTGTDLSSTVANGTTTPVITLQVPTASASNRGALSAADWTTFNNKGSGTVTSVTGTAPVASSGGSTPVISMAAATTSVDGYLTSTDWTTFNNKQPAGSYLVSGGALGTPSSGTVTNLTGTASININGTVGATTPTTGAFTSVAFPGSTSGTATIVATAVAGSPTLTLPTLTGTVGLATRTVQVFTSSSGTYTTPTGCRGIWVRCVGGGGGGGAISGAGGNGGQTTFGTSLLVANGGAGGSTPTGGFGSGGTATGGDINISGGQGGAGPQPVIGSYAPGGSGGNTPFGGGAGQSQAASAGTDGATNSGGGGSGASGGASAGSSGGGGAGGYCEKLISSPSSTYSYAVAAAGAAGSGGTAGGAGGSGVIVVHEYY